MRGFVLLFAAIAFSQSTFVRAQQVGDGDPDLKVERGQFTFNEEGAEGGPNHSRKPRVSSQSSGVMIGRGYDLSQRKADAIVKDLVFCGVSREVAEAYGAAAGLKGEEAKQFLIANQSKLVEITKVQQKKLFELMYHETEAEVRRISDKKETTKVFGKVDWEKLDPRIKEVLVDLRVRGDYTAASRKNIQKSVVDNNFDALKVAMESAQNWRNVPKARFERGLSFVQYMGNTQVTGGAKGIIRLPRDVPGWLSGDVKNLDDIVFDMKSGKDNGTGSNGTHDDGQPEEELKLSPAAIDLLKTVESLRLLPYDDKTGKFITEWVKGATIGYGHLISKDDWDLYKNGISESDAEALFLKDLEPFEDIVRSRITKKLKQNEFDALVILAFNIGRTAFSGSSVVKLINDPNAETEFESLEAAWRSWNKHQGQVSEGLNNRRNCEWQIYTIGVYERW